MPTKSTLPAVSGRALLVDDDKNQLAVLQAILAERAIETRLAADGREALERLNTFTPDVIVTDLMMPGMDGYELLRFLKERGDTTPAIVLTGYGSIEKALQVVHDFGAFWFLEKPVDARAFEVLVDRAIHHKRALQETEEMKTALSLHGVLGDLVGKSRAMQEVYAVIRQAAPTTATVLISGESGTGKELVAREIHKLSTRSKGPFVAVNAAALPETLIESELFGHERGAFTGAVERRAGCFERANGGTLFLDEISEMPLELQPKLLRILEDNKVQRLGGKGDIEVNTRVLAATNRSPMENLRDDLYYRLNVFQIVLPPLRDRKEDIPLIAEVMLQTLNKKHGTRVSNLSPEVLALFHAYQWPGNARELRNVIERSLIVAAVGAVRVNHLPSPFFLASSLGSGEPLPSTAASGGIMLQPGHRMSESDEAFIQLTLQHAGNNRKLAAKMLGISLRTLQTRLNEFRKKHQTAQSA
jgi:DNA-binding NtrC family response regulator